MATITRTVTVRRYEIEDTAREIASATLDYLTAYVLAIVSALSTVVLVALYIFRALALAGLVMGCAIIFAGAGVYRLYLLITTDTTTKEATATTVPVAKLIPVARIIPTAILLPSVQVEPLTLPDTVEDTTTVQSVEPLPDTVEPLTITSEPLTEQDTSTVERIAAQSVATLSPAYIPEDTTSTNDEPLFVRKVRQGTDKQRVDYKLAKDKDKVPGAKLYKKVGKGYVEVTV